MLIIGADDDGSELDRPVSIVVGPPLIDYAGRQACARSLYRIFNGAVYRIFWNTSRPPLETDTPNATATSLPYTTSAMFGNANYYFSVSYFDGALDSGFAPLGPSGQTYLTLAIAGGAAQPAPPSQPGGFRLAQKPDGVIRIIAWYAPKADGANAATEWAIHYTTDGSTPANNAPNVTAAAGKSGLVQLSYDLPAQTNGTAVKVQLQMKNAGGAYSLPLTVRSATAITMGPSGPL
jgi:hypothetical protein